jgi:mono/diheme cytochrome c family protein
VQCALFGSATVPATISLADAPAAIRSGGIFATEPLTATDGREIFSRICQGCHLSDARGAVGAGHYPALAKNPSLASARYVAFTVLFGRRNMPAFGATHAIGFVEAPVALSDAQIAAVTNYVRSHFGNHFKDTITAAEIAALDP